MLVLGSEIDQASSGFEDSNSTDPRRQITISSQNSSQKIKAPSVSSGSSQKGSSKCQNTVHMQPIRGRFRAGVQATSGTYFGAADMVNA